MPWMCKSYEVKATQWFKAGDHPLVSASSSFLPESICPECGHSSKEHGRMSVFYDSKALVHPGDWITDDGRLWSDADFRAGFEWKEPVMDPKARFVLPNDGSIPDRWVRGEASCTIPGWDEDTSLVMEVTPEFLASSMDPQIPCFQGQANRFRVLVLCYLVDPAAPEATGMMCKTFTNDDDYTTFRRPEEYGACWEFVVKAQDILSLVPFQPSEVSHAE